MSRTVGKHPVILANGAAGVSGAFELGANEVIGGIITPAAWVAAALEFETHVGDGVWVPVIGDDGAAVSIVTGAIAGGPRCIVNNGILQDLNGLKTLRLASGPAGARVNQTADRAFTILTKTA